MDRNSFCHKFCCRYHRWLYVRSDCEGRQGTVSTGDRRLLLGLLLAIPSVMVEKPSAVRPGGDIPMFEAMQKAKEPRWVPFTFPIIGAIGVLVGGKLKRRS